MKIELAKGAGFCFGVKRAVNIALETVKQVNPPVYTIGPIIHNPQVVERLRQRGVIPIAEITDLPPGVVIIRSHGIRPDLLRQIKALGHKVVDATCPFVRRAQNYAEQLHREGFKTVIVGKKDHPEVEGLLGHCGPNAVVVYNGSDLKGLSGHRRIGVIAQTTTPFSQFQQVILRLLEKTEELRVYNTTCSSTEKRRKETANLAKRADIMIITGGKNSANTSRLAELCRQIGTETHHIETAAELSPEWFEGKSLVGVSAGTSTPQWIIDEVINSLKTLNQKPKTRRGGSSHFWRQ
ncbi:MAG: 4-hydroxy-3-methylbut-2-enyl diphosphate reductase [Candidatus Latescibacterota bacterium]|nr:MAG: 4-hydroxy-3-methylbut-2-enyl diphosphate reductase [Candidatus Latescibacterota bacterium]